MSKNNEDLVAGIGILAVLGGLVALAFAAPAGTLDRMASAAEENRKNRSTMQLEAARLRVASLEAQIRLAQANWDFRQAQACREELAEAQTLLRIAERCAA